MGICTGQRLTHKVFTPLSVSKNQSIVLIFSLQMKDRHINYYFVELCQSILQTDIEMSVIPTNITGVDENIPTTNIYETLTI